MNTQTHARLVVSSTELNPERLTETIGLTPDFSHRIGDLRRHTIIAEKENVWMLKLNLGVNAQFEDHLNHLLNRVESVSSNLRELSKSERVELGVAIYAEREPPLNVPGELVMRIAQIGAGLDFDLYILGPDNEDDPR